MKMKPTTLIIVIVISLVNSQHDRDLQDISSREMYAEEQKQYQDNAPYATRVHPIFGEVVGPPDQRQSNDTKENQVKEITRKLSPNFYLKKAKSIYIVGMDDKVRINADTTENNVIVVTLRKNNKEMPKVRAQTEPATDETHTIRAKTLLTTKTTQTNRPKTVPTTEQAHTIGAKTVPTTEKTHTNRAKTVATTEKYKTIIKTTTSHKPAVRADTVTTTEKHQTTDKTTKNLINIQKPVILVSQTSKKVMTQTTKWLKKRRIKRKSTTKDYAFDFGKEGELEQFEDEFERPGEFMPGGAGFSLERSIERSISKKVSELALPTKPQPKTTTKSRVQEYGSMPSRKGNLGILREGLQGLAGPQEQAGLPGPGGLPSFDEGMLLGGNNAADPRMAAAFGPGGPGFAQGGPGLGGFGPGGPGGFGGAGPGGPGGPGPGGFGGAGPGGPGGSNTAGFGGAGPGGPAGPRPGFGGDGPLVGLKSEEVRMDMPIPNGGRGSKKGGSLGRFGANALYGPGGPGLGQGPPFGPGGPSGPGGPNRPGGPNGPGDRGPASGFGGPFGPGGPGGPNRPGGPNGPGDRGPGSGFGGPFGPGGPSGPGGPFGPGGPGGPGPGSEPRPDGSPGLFRGSGNGPQQPPPGFFPRYRPADIPQPPPPDPMGFPMEGRPGYGGPTASGPYGFEPRQPNELFGPNGPDFRDPNADPELNRLGRLQNYNRQPSYGMAGPNYGSDFVPGYPGPNQGPPGQNLGPPGQNPGPQGQIPGPPDQNMGQPYRGMPGQVQTTSIVLRSYETPPHPDEIHVSPPTLPTTTTTRTTEMFTVPPNNMEIPEIRDAANSSMFNLVARPTRSAAERLSSILLDLYPPPGQSSPLVIEYKKWREQRKFGKFTGFVAKLCVTMEKLDNSVVRELVQQFTTRFMKDAGENKLRFLGDPLVGHMNDYLHDFSMNPGDQQKAFFALLYKLMEDRKIVLHADVNKMLDYADKLYTDYEEYIMAMLMERIRMYPKSESGTGKTCGEYLFETVLAKKLKDFARNETGHQFITAMNVHIAVNFGGTPLMPSPPSTRPTLPTTTTTIRTTTPSTTTTTKTTPEITDATTVTTSPNRLKFRAKDSKECPDASQCIQRRASPDGARSLFTTTDFFGADTNVLTTVDNFGTTDSVLTASENSDTTKSLMTASEDFGTTKSVLTVSDNFVTAKSVIATENVSTAKSKRVLRRAESNQTGINVFKTPGSTNAVKNSDVATNVSKTTEEVDAKCILRRSIKTVLNETIEKIRKNIDLVPVTVTVETTTKNDDDDELSSGGQTFLRNLYSRRRNGRGRRKHRGRKHNRKRSLRMRERQRKHHKRSRTHYKNSAERKVRHKFHKYENLMKELDNKYHKKPEKPGQQKNKIPDQENSGGRRQRKHRKKRKRGHRKGKREKIRKALRRENRGRIIKALLSSSSSKETDTDDIRTLQIESSHVESPGPRPKIFQLMKNRFDVIQRNLTAFKTSTISQNTTQDLSKRKRLKIQVVLPVVTMKKEAEVTNKQTMKKTTKKKMVLMFTTTRMAMPFFRKAVKITTLPSIYDDDKKPDDEDVEDDGLYKKSSAENESNLSSDQTDQSNDESDTPFLEAKRRKYRRNFGFRKNFRRRKKMDSIEKIYRRKNVHKKHKREIFDESRYNVKDVQDNKVSKRTNASHALKLIKHGIMQKIKDLSKGLKANFRGLAKNLTVSTSYSDEEHVLKSNIYKALGYPRNFGFAVPIPTPHGCR